MSLKRKEPLELEHKQVRISNLHCKEEDRNGVTVGIFEGYASTYELDRGLDRILPGAFEETIQQHKGRDRPIRMLLQHEFSGLIGGYPIEFVAEDEIGLYVRGEINLLKGHPGEYAYSLMKQGVLTDLSIGYSIDSIDDVEFKEDESGNVIREISRLNLWEISLVNEPMNMGAVITSVKAATSYQDLPLADRDREWDSDAAIQRVREFTDSEEGPSTSYRRAFFWYDSENADNFTAYKLPFADVVDGELVAVPRGIFAAAAAMQGARGGVDIPDEDRRPVERHIERYYEKLGDESPFSEEENSKRISASDVDGCETTRDVEQLLKSCGFSVRSRKRLISKVKGLQDWDDHDSPAPDRDGPGNEDSVLAEIFCKSAEMLAKEKEDREIIEAFTKSGV